MNPGAFFFYRGKKKVTIKYRALEVSYGLDMLEKNNTNVHVKTELRKISSALEQDIDMLVTEELWKELRDLEEMMTA